MNLRKKSDERFKQLKTAYREAKSEEFTAHKRTVMVKHPKTGEIMPKTKYLSSISTDNLKVTFF